MEAFAALCRSWYFQQDPEAGRQVQETLKKIPASQRAAYTRLQAQIRSSYHTSVALRRESEFHAHITSTKPGQSLTPLNRQDPSSESARQERLERFEKLVSVWATAGNVGVKPFFDGLYAVLRLQGLPEKLGGAGEKRVAWEVDDAVFKESAGKEFMLEAIDVLKGVLGFEETVITEQRNGDITPSSITANERLTASDPPPLPARPRGGSKSAESSLYKPRPALPTIASASAVQQSDVTVNGSPIEPQVVVVEDDLEDTFADPVPRKPAIPPRRKVQNSTQNHDLVENRTRSQSDPFDDTNGHLPYGYGHTRSRTQGSITAFSPTAPSPSMTPLLVPGGSSVGTGTTSESVLAKATTETESQPKRPLSLPPEDFELEVTGPGARLAAPTPGLQDSDDEESGEILGDSEASDRRSTAFGLGFMGKARRGSETTGLGLLGATKQADLTSSSAKASTIELDKSTAPSRSITPVPPLPPHDLTPNAKVDGFVPAHATYGSIDGNPYMRTWFVPSYLTNPELSKLLAVFPPSIARGNVPRFRGAVQDKDDKKRRGAAANDLEAQTENLTEEREYLRYGTGRIYLSDAGRDEGWRGSMWERFVGWWRRLFC